MAAMDQRKAFLIALFDGNTTLHSADYIIRNIKFAFENDPSVFAKELDPEKRQKYYDLLGGSPPIKCETIRQLLAKAIFNNELLTDAEEDMVYQHLSECIECMKWLDDKGELRIDFKPFRVPKSKKAGKV